MKPDFDPQTYWQQRLQADFDLRGVGYLRLGRAYNAWLYRLRRRVFLQAIRRLDLDLPNLSALDVGAGTGFYIERWLELGVRQVAGVDFTQAAVASLRRRYPGLAFTQGDIGHGLGADHLARYDLISIMDVLFHIVDDQAYARALANLAACLKPGGYLILSENFLHGPRHSGMHQVSRRLDEIEAGLAAAGLDILSRRPMFWLMNAPFDSGNSGLKLFWKGLAWSIARGEWAGQLAGALLYWPELLALRFLREGPSTELMVCRKPANGPGAGALP